MSYYSLRTPETSRRWKSAAPSADDPTHNRKEQADERPLPKPKELGLSRSTGRGRSPTASRVSVLTHGHGRAGLLRGCRCYKSCFGAAGGWRGAGTALQAPGKAGWARILLHTCAQKSSHRWSQVASVSLLSFSSSENRIFFHSPNLSSNE